MHYRHLEREKITGLQYLKGSFEGTIRLSAKAIAEMQWWINNIDNSCHYINMPNPNISIYTMQVLQVGVSLTVHPHPGDSSIRQS